MKKKRISKHLWLTLAIMALLVPVASNIEGIKLTSTIRAQDGEQENQNPESKKIESVVLKTVGNTRLGIQYRKKFTLTDVDSEYTLAYSCVGWRCGCNKAEKEVEASIAEEFLKVVETLEDQGASAKCCDHAWTEINLNYSDGSNRKITVNDAPEFVGAKLFNIACGGKVSLQKRSNGSNTN